MLNMDFSRSAVINTGSQSWVPSPQSGVWRKPLAREDAESGHATSIVKYEPGSSFKSHNHPLGEEILVLEGTFSDETGDFHAGTYFRNPKGFIHTPHSDYGCLLLVKLHQFQAQDSVRLCIDTKKAEWTAQPDGSAQLPLHHYGTERVSMLRIPAGRPVVTSDEGNGLEILVLEGRLEDAREQYPASTWLRHPSTHTASLHALEPCLLWVKTGHLPASA